MNWSFLNLCINCLETNYQTRGNKILFKLKKSTPMKIDGQTSRVYFLSRVSKNADQNKFEYRGVKLWNKLGMI